MPEQRLPRGTRCKSEIWAIRTMSGAFLHLLGLPSRRARAVSIGTQPAGPKWLTAGALLLRANFAIVRAVPETARRRGVPERMTASNETAAGIDAVAAIEGVVDTIAASRIRSAVAILIVALIAFLPGFKTVPPLDRDEPWLALGSKYMVETGDYADAGFVKGPRILQPIAIQWLQAASVAVFGGGASSPIWLYRLPSLLGAIAAAYATWWMALAFGRPRAALLAALLMATTPLLVAEAHLAKTDGIFLAATVLAQGALARLWLKKDNRPDYRLAFVFWSAIGLGLLVKGLTPPIIIALTIGVLSASAGSFDWLRRLAPAAGAVWLAILVAP